MAGNRKDVIAVKTTGAATEFLAGKRIAVTGVLDTRKLMPAIPSTAAYGRRALLLAAAIALTGAMVVVVSSKTGAQRSQLLGRSQRPWTKTTGVRPVALLAESLVQSGERLR